MSRSKVHPPPSHSRCSPYCLQLSCHLTAKDALGTHGSLWQSLLGQAPSGPAPRILTSAPTRRTYLMAALDRDIVKTLRYLFHVLNSNITLYFKKWSFHLVNVRFFVAGHYGFKTLTLAPFFFYISTVFRTWTLRFFSNMYHLLV